MSEDAEVRGAPGGPPADPVEFHPPEEAEQDRRSERALIWKALIAALVVGVFVAVRQVFFA